MFTRKVPADQIEKVLEWTANYRRYRLLRRKLRTLQGQILDTADRLERIITERTAKPLDYLRTAPNLHATTDSE
jgi:hypothetical protein